MHRPLAFYAAFFSIRAKAFDATVMCQGMERCKAKMKEIQDKAQFKEKEKRPTAVEEDMLVTLEVVYEFYLRGFQFERMDVLRSQATRFMPDEEKGTLLPPFMAIPGLGETAALNLVAARQARQDFISIEEIAAACPKVSEDPYRAAQAGGRPSEPCPRAASCPCFKKRRRCPVIRLAQREDLSAILAVYEAARRYMRENGNPTQWGESYPERSMLEEDIRRRQLYVDEQEGSHPRGVCFYPGGGPHLCLHRGRRLAE